ncbi:MAG: M20/M25/M40 family metallo-hydrolase [Alphaproteobacteria bacterium]|nr:M20/M25/M40 family metallo-hydrolase [Alphaproteobacteria bacterium]
MLDAALAARMKALVRLDRCRELLVDLVRVPSPQTELLEAEPLLREFIRKAVDPKLRAMGVDRIRYDAMGNLIAELGENATGRSLMLITNAMNQPQATMKNAYAGDVIDARPHGLPGEAVLGKGASEQKGHMASVLHAIEVVRAAGLPIRGRLIVLCCTSGETGRHDAIRSIIEGEGVRADMAVLGGTGLKLTLGNRGRIDVFVTVHGTPSHSAKPFDGANAITGAIEVIGRVLKGVKLDGSHPDLGRPTLTVNHIRSFPDATHTVQDRCEITFDRRLLPGDDPQAAFEEIRKLAMGVDGMKDPASGKPLRVEVVLGPFMHPSLVTPDSPVVRAVQASAQAMLGREVEMWHAPSAFDQGYLNHVGIPTCNFGAGEHQFAHTDLDMASVDRVADAAAVFAGMIAARLC